MKKILLCLAAVLVLSACSNTWNGVKEDSSKAWTKTKQVSNEAVDSTKHAIHKATADDKAKDDAEVPTETAE